LPHAPGCDRLTRTIAALKQGSGRMGTLPDGMLRQVGPGVYKQQIRALRPKK
jgi:hypothetical protein